MAFPLNEFGGNCIGLSVCEAEMTIRCDSLPGHIHGIPGVLFRPGPAGALLTLVGCLCAFGPLPAGAAGLRVITTLDDTDPVFAAVRYLADLSEQTKNQPGSVETAAGGSDMQRTAAALDYLRSERADVAVVPLADIADKPIFSYSLQPFLSPDIGAARRLDLRMRADIARILDSDLGLALLGTLPQLPRVMVGTMPQWDGILDYGRVVTLTSAERDGFQRIGARYVEQANAQSIGSVLGKGPAFGVVPLTMADTLATRGPYYVYDVRPSYPVMVMVATKRARAYFDDTSKLPLSDLATGLEQIAWERIDRIAEDVFARLRKTAKMGELRGKFPDNLGNLFMASLEANAQNSVSELVAYSSQRELKSIEANGDRQVYGKKCRVLDVLLVTNRALPANLAPGNVGPLPRRGSELLATNSPQPHYGVVTLQVHAYSFDPPSTQVDCKDADGRPSAPREEVHGVRLVPKAEFEKLAAEKPPGFDATAPFMLFVHGYRVDFRAAAEAVGRLSVQMKNRLRPVLFSWPSAGSLLGYGDDGKMAALSPGALTETIETLARLQPRRPINLIAHSMGNRVMLDTLDALRQSPRRPAPGVLDELVSIAPDVECAKYATIAGRVQGDADPAKRSFRRATLYLYEKDYALRASKLWWATRDRSETCRMGSRRGPAAAPLRGMEAIDWSCINEVVDSHSYYIGNDFIARDLRDTVQGHMAPRERELEPIDVSPDQYFLHVSKVDRKCAGVP